MVGYYTIFRDRRWTRRGPRAGSIVRWQRRGSMEDLW